MEQKPLDVIQHLLEVEDEASQLVLNAQKKREEILSEARVQQEEKFSSEYKKIKDECDAKWNDEASTLTLEHQKSLDSYKESLLQTAFDTDGFFSFMDGQFFN